MWLSSKNQYKYVRFIEHIIEVQAIISEYIWIFIYLDMSEH